MIELSMEGMFSCGVCSSEFSFRKDLLQHIRSHSSYPLAISNPLLWQMSTGGLFSNNKDRAQVGNEYNIILKYVDKGVQVALCCCSSKMCPCAVDSFHTDEQRNSREDFLTIEDISALSETADRSDETFNHRNITDPEQTCVITDSAEGTDLVINSHDEENIQHNGLSTVSKTELKENSTIAHHSESMTIAEIADDRHVHRGLKCDLCPKVITRSMLVHKINVHTVTPSFECGICADGKIFKQLKDYELHKFDVHNPNSQFKCDVCAAPFSVQGELIRHVEIHRKTCHICRKVFATHLSKTKHMHVNHTVTPSYKCDHCCKVMKQLRDFENHEDYNQRYKSETTCAKCERSFDFPCLLRAHSKCKSLSCDLCGRVFNQRFSLKTHMARHTGERNFSCETCGKRFRSKKVLNDHQYVHSTDRAHVCSICGMSFIRPNALTRHRYVHGEKKFTCKSCGMAFKSPEIVYIHEKRWCRTREGISHRSKSTEKRENKNLCKYCGLVFKSYPSRWFHENNTCKSHVGKIRSHLCHVCGRSFFSQSGVRKHMLYVHRESSSLCTFCGKTYKNSLTRYMHERKYCKSAASNTNVETRKKLTSMCTFCGKTYKTSASRRIHERKYCKSGRAAKNTNASVETRNASVETRSEFMQKNNRFPCTFCGKMYKTSVTRYKHERRYCKSGRVETRKKFTLQNFRTEVSFGRAYLDVYDGTHQRGVLPKCAGCSKGLSRSKILVICVMAKPRKGNPRVYRYCLDLGCYIRPPTGSLLKVLSSSIIGSYVSEEHRTSARTAGFDLVDV